MKVIFKLPAYVEIMVPDGTNRATVSKCFDETVMNSWDVFLSKIRLDSSEIAALRDTLGQCSVKFLSAPVFTKD